MIAIIIGFQYTTDKYIGGIIRDLYLIYKFCRNKFSNIIIITDIECVDKSYLRELILNEHAEEDIYNFFNEIKSNNSYSKYDNVDNFIETLNKLRTEERVMLYYTGHLEYSHIILPGNSVYHIHKLIELFDHDCDVMLIFDCCNCTDMTLPFMLINNHYKLIGRKFIRGRVVLLSPTLENEYSYSNRYGSLFTDNLIKCLVGYPTLSKLVKSMNYRNQKLLVFSSYPNIHRVWNWILGKKLIVNIDHNVLKIKYDRIH